MGRVCKYKGLGTSSETTLVSVRDNVSVDMSTGWFSDEADAECDTNDARCGVDE